MNIEVNIKQQQLKLYKEEQILKTYSISSAKNGIGEQSGSECTPRGKHIIRAKIGFDCPENTVFVGRRSTGEIFSENLRESAPNRDWILTRIMWLSGCETGKNRLKDVDTMRRYIYIHGCPNKDKMGIPNSHGCIKMRNADIKELFDLVKPYTQVTIY